MPHFGGYAEEQPNMFQRSMLFVEERKLTNNYERTYTYERLKDRSFLSPLKDSKTNRQNSYQKVTNI